MDARGVARGLLGNRVVAGTLRAATSWSGISEATRERAYGRVKRIPLDPTSVFSYQIGPDAELSLHPAGTILRLYWTGAYEPESLLVFAAYARRSALILDVGTADGIYTLCAAAANPSAQVVSFEPGELQRTNLAANLAANRAMVADRVVVLPVALADHDGTADFYGLGGTASLNPDFRSTSVHHTIDVARGDQVIADRFGSVPVALIKIDTESTEPAVLRGLAATIARDRPAIFCEVLSGRTEGDLQALVDEWGYRTYWLSGSGPVRRHRIEGDPTHRYLNWLFLPDDTPPLSA